jgi:hypothetical protein
MPKSKRARVVHTSSVTKKTREHKERLFESIRECIPQYQHCFVVTVDNMRNTYLKDVRRELSDSRYVSLSLSVTPVAHNALYILPISSSKFNLANYTLK